MEQDSSHFAVALVVGVTGMAGLSLAEALKSPNALGGPWKVYGAARRPMPVWFPPSTVDSFITLDAMNLDDTSQKLSPISNQVTHVFWVAIQVRQAEEDNVTVNSVMLSNAQLIQQYDTPFREDTPRLPYPNFYHALEDLAASYGPTVTYSVHRSSIIIGASSRSVYNALLTLTAYAEICKHEGLRFRFPGTRYTWEHFCDMSDARVLAEQQIWAAVTPRAKNEAFNCTNGDVFTWRSLWKVLCEAFDLEFEALDETQDFDFVGLMKGKGQVWDDIVAKHGLHRTKLEEISCPDAMNHVLHFGFQHVCSMNKSREYGFYKHVDTLKSMKMWLQRLRQMKIIP
ncbi:hypothetical protein FNV43_RR00961 [Rhamnella rubrinervis]|uniref:PRISE-like Rossmann-fold domain-containing protein n=1 Tax=Rhamnella rubrinervis TaxID=2594499 RepID=A0A8K0HPJ0_9ROSA|nr:hypothetical protein FNV43_RR00961 [Rhamnella rubrinervis]